MTGSNKSYYASLKMTGLQEEAGQNSRSAPPLFLSNLSFRTDPVYPGITPFLPKTVNQPSARTMTGLRRDPSGKMRLYVFGFTRNNA